MEREERMSRRFALLAASFACALCAAVPAFAANAIVSSNSPAGNTPQNHQNEPAVALDANRPNVLVAGWNDFVDWAPCPQKDATQFGTCADPADDGVGLSGVSFSFDSGHTWIQPTYQGWTANDCAPTTTCTPHVGTIHTLPNYYENRLVSSGDPAVAFGPIYKNGSFSWANGERVYYANLVGAWPSGFAFPNPEFHRHLGLGGNFPAPLTVSVSPDGGDSWTTKQITPAGTTGLGPTLWGISGCTLRTDSRGVVYLFAEMFQNPFLVGLPTHGFHVLYKSFDGGRSWTKQQIVRQITDPCFFVDPVYGRCVIYEADTAPWRGADMTSPRPYHGVFLAAPVAMGGGPGAWAAIGGSAPSANVNDLRST